MKNFLRVIFSLCGLAGSVVCARAQAAPPSPAQLLGFYVGAWSESGQSRADPAQPYGNLTGQETCIWHRGRLAVVCREATTDKAGKVDSIYILAYDTARKVYTVNGVDNAGTVLSGTGRIENGQWIWNVKAAADGTMTRMRFTFDPADKGARKMSVAVARAGDSWAEVSSVLYDRRK